MLDLYARYGIPPGIASKEEHDCQFQASSFWQFLI
jgi:hypothetical protein